MRSDVEGGVIALYPGGGHGFPVPQRADLLPVSLLDRDVIPVRAAQVDGGSRPQYIEGDPVVAGQDGHPAGADLIGRVPVGRYPVAAPESGLDPAVFHDDGGHIIADEGHVYPSLLKLPGGEPSSLEQRPGLVREYP